VFLLAEGAMLMGTGQVLALAEHALGIVPNPALRTALGANQNAIKANPIDHTLLWHELVDIIFLETLTGIPPAVGNSPPAST
jgi:hypothetical protein